MLFSLTIAMLASAAMAPEAAPSMSPQAMFDAATSAHVEGRHEEAIRLFSSLEQLKGVKNTPNVLAAVLLRKGLNQIELDRVDDGEKTLRAALKIASPDHPELNGDRFFAERALGNIELDRLNYAAATDHFGRALAVAETDQARANARVSLASSTMFDTNDDALGHIDAALAVATASPSPSKEEKRVIAQLQTVRARALLNRGRFTDAYAVLRRAISDQGGLDLTVRFDEIATRSDLAITALLAGREEDARKYMAYTGAGRIENAPFALAVAMPLPSCGGPADLKPEDVAVVEFAIRTDGSVSGARPIYSSARGPAAAAEYAKAVLGWSWRPETIAKVPDLFRVATRVELRCTTTAPRPSVIGPLNLALSQWLGQPPLPEASKGDAAALAPLKAELARQQSAGNERATIGLLTLLGTNAVANADEREAWLIDARDRAIRAGAPLAARVAIEVRLAGTDSRGDHVNRYRTSLRQVLARPEAAEDPVVSDTLRLLIADPLWNRPPPADAPDLLREVADDERLSPHHPLRVGALIRQAAAYAASGDRAAAEASFRRTGLAEQQCALLDARPQRLATNVSANDFPMEAARWGFEGWVRTEYDINADGRTSNQRAIVAYPPFVFRNAALGIMRDVRYAQSYRPDGTAGCGAAQENIRFGIPLLRNTQRQ